MKKGKYGRLSMEPAFLYHIGAWEGQLCLLCIQHFDGVICSMVRVVNQVLRILTLAYNRTLSTLYWTSA